jgi:hypothetical protein
MTSKKATTTVNDNNTSEVTMKNTTTTSNQARSKNVPAKASNTLLAPLDALMEARKKWQVSYDHSNEGLYQLLANCLGLYTEIKGMPTEKATLTAIKKQLVERGVTIQKNSTVFNLIVRYVFNSERRRSHIYAKALAVAIDKGITKEAFPSWVDDFGGIEEVATQKANVSKQKKSAEFVSQIESVKNMLITQIASPLAVVPKTTLLNSTDTQDYTLLIGKMQADGKTRVLSVVPNTSATMVNMAIANIAGELLKQYEETHKTKLDEERQAIMGEMLAEALGTKKGPKLKKAA